MSLLSLLLFSCSADDSVQGNENNTEEIANVVVEAEVKEEVDEEPYIKLTDDEALELVYEWLNSVDYLFELEILTSKLYMNHRYETFETMGDVEEILSTMDHEAQDKVNSQFSMLKKQLENYVLADYVDEFFEGKLLSYLEFDKKYLNGGDLGSRFKIEEQDANHLTVSFIRFGYYYTDQALFTVTFEREADDIRLATYEKEILDVFSPPLSFEDIEFYWHLNDPQAKLRKFESTNEYIKYQVITNYFDYLGIFENDVANNIHTGEIENDETELFSHIYEERREADDFRRKTTACQDNLYDCYYQKLREVSDEQKRRDFIIRYSMDTSSNMYTGGNIELFNYHDEILAELVRDIKKTVDNWSDNDHENWLKFRDAEIEGMDDQEYGLIATSEAYSYGFELTRERIKNLMDDYLLDR